MRLKPTTNQRGDTIVEVLISIAVIGLVLGGAYVAVNTNTQNNVAAQERSTAVKLAETQLELLRSHAATAGALPTGRFCLEAGATIVKHDIAGPIPAPNNTAPGYPGECLVDDGSATDRYVVGIQQDLTDANRYTVYVSWDGPSSRRAHVSIAYKVYEP